jgi:hypothetical protein
MSFRFEWLFLAFVTLLSGAVYAQDVVVGVNVVNPMRASVADQNAVFDQLQAAHVQVIRCGISNDDKGIDFAKRAAAKGIRIMLGVGALYSADAPTRPYQPEQFPSMWSGHPLSYADPELSRAFYQKLFDALDAGGIVLAGIELGNEMNWAAFNAEFPLPGEGKILSLADLSHDPEGQQIAKGFLQYLKILAVLKKVRDHSRLNRKTPIISAGLVSAPDGDKLYNNKREDMVSLPATIAFLRASGLDALVDGYGIHTYPSTDHPGDPAAAGRRSARFESVDLGPCRAPGQPGGKPCWITEWGFPNSDLSCPTKDSARRLLVQEMRVSFAKAAAEHRLAAITYFAWNSDPWSKQPDADSIYRCSALSDSGRLAVAPLTDVRKPNPYAAMRVRVGAPLVARGPAPNIADSAFSTVQLPDGHFRGFTAAGVTWAVDGAHPYDMGGPALAVLEAGPPNTPDSCGQWIVHVELQGKLLYGWDHSETACNYGKSGQTHASMTIATSADYGHTWKIEGPIITGTDPPHDGKETGDSCVNVVRGQDGYDYAYCVHNGGHSWDGGYGFVARAPSSNPGPGQWKKYFNGEWSEPGVGGKSSAIDGGGTAWWKTTAETVGLKWVKGGIGLITSADRLHFQLALPQPLMLTEPGDWSRKNGLELISYPDLIDAKTGLNQLDDHWLLAYMYINPAETFGKRYLVFRPVDISWSSTSGDSPVGEMLVHWYSAAEHEHWATTAPVPGNYSAYRLVAQLGYVLTAPDPSKPTVELEECISKWPGHPDRILIQKGVCETQDYQRLRSAGFIYSTGQPNTQPLYRCYSDAEHSHFASNRDDCNTLGRREALLGYDLKE